ncbi:MAG: APC family permease [Pseudomonadales bacterium]
MTLFTVSALLLLDTLAASASIGVPSLFWWVFLGIIFMVPYALITAELGTAYPEQGGIYAWVRDSFGTRWGSRITWLYWFNAVIWNASICILFSGVFSQMFFPDLSFTIQLAIAISLNWLVTLLTCVSLSVGKWVPNTGAILKLIVFVAVIGGGIAFVLNGEVELANEFSWSALTPEWGSSTQYLSTIVYGMLGFELMSSASEEMENPTRDIPRAIFWSGLIVFSMYFLGTFAILVAIPAGEINLVEGLVDTLRMLFGNSTLGVATATLLGTFALVTFFTNATTWSLGCNRAVAEAAIDGEMPNIFGKEHAAYGTPVGAAIMMGIGATLLLLIYAAVVGSNEDLFWSLFAASGVLFLIPYVGAIAAFYYMRIHDGERERPFKVRGGNSMALFLSIVCIAILLMTIFLFMYVPGSGFDWPVVIGSFASIVLGELLIRFAEYENKQALAE